MIRYTQGNLLDAPAEALVNPVNEVGVMGKGIALLFREAFPQSAEIYEKAAKAGDVRVVLAQQHFQSQTIVMLGREQVIIDLKTRIFLRAAVAAAEIGEHVETLVFL